MGLLECLLNIHKNDQPDKAQARPVEQPQLFQAHHALNRRGSIRYLVVGIGAGKLGKIVNISRSGCRITKASPDLIEALNVPLRLGDMRVNGKIIWQDEESIGLEFASGLGDPVFVYRRMKRVSNAKLTPIKVLHVEAIIEHIAKDPFSNMLNLLAEVESPNTNINKLKSLIIKLPDLGTEMVTKAATDKAEDEIELRDVDQAVKRLGLDASKQIILEFIKTNRQRLESVNSNNSLYESMKAVKKVFFESLAPYCGYTCDTGLVDNLATAEYKGIDIIIEHSQETPKVKEFYITPKMIYSEMTRFCERLIIGRDALNINRINVRTRKSLTELFDGYMLAHLILNPAYTLDSYVELTVNKINLSYAFITYVTFISAAAIIEKDPASIAAFKDRLHSTGMESGELNTFVSNYVSEINRTMTDLGRSSNLKAPTAGKGFKIADYLSVKEIPQYGRFIKAFHELDTIKRMVIAYEDDAYTHFILGKVLAAEDAGLNSKMYCVIPCENLSSTDIKYDSFSFFSVVVLKNIDKLSKFHLRLFIKLWNHFDGILIITFNRYSMFDFNHRDLYVLLRDYIIDFPSYFEQEKVYNKMMDHTAAYMAPYVDIALNITKYQTGIYSMNTVRGCEILRTQPVAENEEDADNPLVE
ncbi:MAG: hypothetical protein HQK97_00790 [Nitrospirae bacterium]|nr:hypothetical protein [Nitrospirota bacterium]